MMNDRLAQKSYNGWFLTSDEYWNDNLKATRLGLEEAVRIYLVSQMQYFVANKDRFNSRMLYGLGDGLNNWSIRSADVKPNDKDEKVLRVTQYSARGGLFMSAWDPLVSTDSAMYTVRRLLRPVAILPPSKHRTMHVGVPPSG